MISLPMIYVTEQDLKNNIREVRSEIKLLAKEQGSELKYLENKIKELEMLIEGLTDQIKLLSNGINNYDK